MRKTLLAASMLAAFALPAVSNAQTAPAAAPAAEKSPHTITGNLGIFSSYRFRGIDQTFGKPALQGGIDYSHESGFYAGNWNSNVSQGAGYPGGNLEMDFYGGWKKRGVTGASTSARSTTTTRAPTRVPPTFPSSRTTAPSTLQPGAWTTPSSISAAAGNSFR